MNKQLLFVGGFPSGGTDLLRSILNVHPSVDIGGEMPFIYNLNKYGVNADYLITTQSEKEYIEKVVLEKDIWSNVENLESTSLSSEVGNEPISLENYFSTVFSSSDALYCGNKTPQNTENIDLLRTYFPNARFIVVVRDIRDIVLSWRKKWGKNMSLTAQKWNKRMQNIEESDDILIVKFEDLIGNLELTVKSICKFLEIEESDRMLNHQLYMLQAIDGKINYGKKVIASNKNKWEELLSKNEIKEIESLAFSSLNKFGYSVRFAKKQKELNWVSVKTKNILDLIAMLLVGNRFKNNNSLKERLKEIKRQIQIRMK